MSFFAFLHKSPSFGTRTILEVEPNAGVEGGIFQIKEAKLGVKMEEEGRREEGGLWERQRRIWEREKMTP